MNKASKNFDDTQLVNNLASWTVLVRPPPVWSVTTSTTDCRSTATVNHLQIRFTPLRCRSQFLNFDQLITYRPSPLSWSNRLSNVLNSNSLITPTTYRAQLPINPSPPILSLTRLLVRDKEVSMYIQYGYIPSLPSQTYHTFHLVYVQIHPAGLHVLPARSVQDKLNNQVSYLCLHISN